MKIRNTAVNSRVRNTAFSALLLTAFGYLLLEAGLFRHGARAGAHLLGTLVAAALFGLTWRSGAFDRSPVTADGLVAFKIEKGHLITSAKVISFLLLLGIGYVAADVLRSYWATPFVLFAACIYLCPWSRIPLCRTNTLAPICIIALGGAARMYSAPQLPDPIILAFGVWTFWTIAAASLLTLFLLKKQERNRSEIAL